MFSMGSGFVFNFAQFTGDQSGSVLSLESWFASMGVSPLFYLPLLAGIILSFALILRAVLRQFAQRSLYASSTLQDITHLVAGIGGVLVGGLVFGSVLSGLLCGISFILLCADSVALGRADAKEKAEQTIYSEVLASTR